MTTHPLRDDFRRLREQLELDIHLASMEVRTRWQALQPRFAHLDEALQQGGKAVSREASALWTALTELRDEIADQRRDKRAIGE